MLKILVACLLTTALYSEGKYSAIREEILLAKEEERGVGSVSFLQRTASFNRFAHPRVNHFSRSAELYAYNSESVDDLEWGCAWRAIQTSLSPYYKPPSFKDLYETFGGREFIASTAREHGITAVDEQDWLAPHEEWHMWGDPFIGHMIFLSLGIESSLIAVHDIPSSYSPKYAEEIVDFRTFSKLICDHFKKGGYPAMIDNGTYALNIIGADKKWGNLYLMIMDPHLNADRNKDSLNGLYIVEIDQEGHQVSIDYPAKKNHFDPMSYKTLQFSKETKWSVLLSGERI
ncbi:MAG: hypothetical protein KDK48_03095 [Chlamydiia bacterium]|nr:hypothetical protein [Chlamydiia bacterium]